MAKKVKVKRIKKKTHSGLKKASQGVLHNTGKRSSKTNRQKRNSSELHKSDYKRIKDLI